MNGAALHSVNGVALLTLKVVYSLVIDVQCFSHTSDQVGGCFITPILSDFIMLWICLFSHTPNTRLCGGLGLTRVCQFIAQQGGGANRR